MSTTTTDAVLNGIATVTASTIAVQAVLDLIASEYAVEAAVKAETEAKEAAKAAKAEVRAAAERVDDRLAAACGQIVYALTQKGVSARSLAADLKDAGASGWSKDQIAMAQSVSAAIDLPGEVRPTALRTGWFNANRAKGVSRADIAAVLKASSTREEVLQGWEALVNPVVESDESEGDEGETDEVEGRTPWQERLSALVAQALLEGGEPDEIREVVEAAL